MNVPQLGGGVAVTCRHSLHATTCCGITLASTLQGSQEAVAIAGKVQKSRHSFPYTFTWQIHAGKLTMPQAQEYNEMTGRGSKRRDITFLLGRRLRDELVSFQF